MLIYLLNAYIILSLVLIVINTAWLFVRKTNNKGATTVEYALLAAILSLVVIASFHGISAWISHVLGRVL